MRITVNLLAFVFFIVPWIATVGWLTSRVLGIRLGRWKTAIVAVLWLGLPASQSTGLVHDHDPGLRDAVLTTLFFGVMVAMPLAVILDLLTRRSGTNRSPGADSARQSSTPCHPPRSARAVEGRMREVVTRRATSQSRPRPVPNRGSPRFPRLTAPRPSAARRDGGGMMVKFGQIASTRTDLLPEGVDDGAFPSALRRAPDPAGSGSRRARTRARRVDHRHVRRLRLGTTRRRVDRPDASCPPRHR